MLKFVEGHMVLQLIYILFLTVIMKVEDLLQREYFQVQQSFIFAKKGFISLLGKCIFCVVSGVTIISLVMMSYSNK